MANFAIVVGINEYPARTGLPTLKGAVADAAAFAEWALSPAGDVPPTNLYFWTSPAVMAPGPRLTTFLAGANPWKDATSATAPTTDDFWLLILALRQRPDVKNGRVYIYLAGHGMMTVPLDAAQRSQSCFVPGDFLPALASRNLVATNHVVNAFAAFGVETVVFQDCCRSSFPPNVQAPASPINLVAPTVLVSNWLNARPTQPGRLAYEVPTADPNRGAFTVHLMDGLQSYGDAGKALSGSELEEYVSAGLVQAFAGTNLQQVPDFSDSFPGAWRFFVLNARTAAPPTVVTSPSDAGSDTDRSSRGGVSWEPGEEIDGVNLSDRPDVGGFSDKISEIGEWAATNIGPPDEAAKPNFPALEIDHSSRPASEKLILLDWTANKVAHFGKSKVWRRQMPLGSYAVATEDLKILISFNHVGPESTHVQVP